jgi:signal transduction histidine kinase
VKIRSKLIMIATLPVALLMVLAYVFLTATNAVDHATNKAIVADEMRARIAELSILTYEHHIYFEDRAHVQWTQKYETLGKLLQDQGAIFAAANEKELVDRLQRTYRNIGYLFEQYAPHGGGGRSAPEAEQDKGFRNRITARLLQELAVAAPATTKLHDLNHDQALVLSQRIDAASVLVVGITAVLLLAISFLVIRAFSVPVRILDNAFAKVSAGDLGWRINSLAKDELGSLSRSFDAMAQRLQESDNSLRVMNLELEQRIHERTAELSLANAELTRMIAAGKEAEQSLKLNEERLAALLELSQMRFGSEQELLTHSLEEAVRLTRSEVGYLHFFDEARQTLGLFQWSKAVMTMCTAEKTPHYPLAAAGVWADCVRQQQPVVHNDYPNLATKKGVPPGHFPLLRHMSVPIFENEKIVAIIGVGNKGEAYDDSDVRQLTLYMRSTWEIVKRKRAEETLLRYATSLEQSNKELEHFAYVASHDLQEPLRKIGSFTELLANKYQDQLDDKASTYIGYIVDGAHRMQGLINDLLSLSRVATKGKAFTLVDCNAIMGRVRQDLEVAVQECGARITAVDLPLVMADDLQLGQVFQNLIANAIKYRAQGVPPDIRVTAAADKGEWLFAVSDNGIGIEPQHFDRVFQLFQRLHTREEYSGTGIGLALCKKIVERHGGRIWVESTQGKGSTFFFTLPVGAT